MNYIHLNCRETYTHGALKLVGGGECQKVGADLPAAKGHIILRTLLDCEMKLLNLFTYYFD